MKFICRKPGQKSLDIINRDNKVISQCVTREYDFVFHKAKGNYIWDVDGNKYLDFAAGIAVANIGHDNPEVIKAINEQLKKGLHIGFSDFYAETPINFIETLLSLLPNHLNNAFLSNSGTEAVEAGYKLARWHTNKKYVIAFKNAFHGRTMGSLSLTNSKPVQRDRYSPFLPVKHAPFPNPYRHPTGNDPEKCSRECLEELEQIVKSVKGDLAAIIVEPIQGEGGYIVPPKNFLPEVQKTCKENSALFMVDEVQAGCMRTGPFLASSNFKIKPDIVSLSKAIGGGMPLGATIANKKTMDWVPGSHANTFGGNLLACAAGQATLKYMKKHKLGERAKKLGKHILNRLKEVQEDLSIVGDVRGLGLMIGVELVKDKKTKEPAVKERRMVLCNAFEQGLILLPAGISTIRLCPPLTITLDEADHAVDVLEESLKVVR